MVLPLVSASFRTCPRSTSRSDAVFWAVVVSAGFVPEGGVETVCLGSPVDGVKLVVVVRPSVRLTRTGVASPVAVTSAVRSVTVRRRP